MSDDDIDLDRVVTDPKYRRQVIEFLNGTSAADRAEDPAKAPVASLKTSRADRL